MLGEQKRTVKEFFVYWRGLLKDAIATSGRFSGAAKKISTILISGGVLSLIGIKSGFTPSQWLWYPAGAMLLVIFFFMHISAFNMHRKQEARIKGLEDAMSVKLSVERITYQSNAGRGYSCRVTIRNVGKSAAKNVHVRMSGEVLPGTFIEGHSPFHEPDLIPASSSQINPGAESDWLFTDSFNQMVRVIHMRIEVPPASVQKELGVKRPTQTFTVAASAENSPPTQASFSISAGTRGSGPDFDKI